MLFTAKSGRGIQIQITDLLLLVLFQRRQTHCTILANDVVFCSRLFTADTVYMSYSTSSTLHQALLLEVIHRPLGLFLSFLHGTIARSIQASISKLPRPHKPCSALPFSMTIRALLGNFMEARTVRRYSRNSTARAHLYLCFRALSIS